jgi:[ribosomal protein S5]-alanine N-acetyltransferase
VPTENREPRTRLGKHISNQGDAVLPDRFETAGLFLRPIVRGDAAAIFAGYAQDPEVVRYLTWRPHQSLAETDAYIARCLAAPIDRSRTYVLTRRTDGSLIGAFELRRPAPHRLDFGYVLARAYWRQGLMTEALSEIVRWAMSQDDIWRIGAVCDVDNPASARVMEKAGLDREGVLRRWLVHPNLGPEPRDCFSYAITRSASGGANMAGGGRAPGATPIEVGAALANGTIRYWKATEAVRQGELLLGSQIAALTRLMMSASSVLGWSVTISLAIPTALASAKVLGSALTPSPHSTTGTDVLNLMGRLLWPGILAESFLLIAAICCFCVLWPSKWHPPGHEPNLVVKESRETELEVLEAMAGGYAAAVDRNAAKLTRLERWLKGAWICFIAAPIVAAMIYALG